MVIDTQTRDLEQEMNEAFAISDFYQLLSLSLQYPSLQLVEAITNGSFVEDGLAILEDLKCSPAVMASIEAMLKNIQKLDQQQLHREIRQEYTRLFNHPKGPVISIYESLFLHDPRKNKERPMLFLSPAALDAEKRYEEAGVAQSDKSEPADHFAIELEFMTFLYASLGRAIQFGEMENAEKLKDQIAQFEKIHIKRWIPLFFCCLEDEAHIGFYQGIAKLAIEGSKMVFGNEEEYQ